MSFIFACFVFLFFGCKTQECLRSPDHVAHEDSIFQDAKFSGSQTNWIYDSDLDAYRYTLTFDGVEINKFINNRDTTFTTRVFDKNIPGKSLIVRRGNHYIITLKNNLLPNSDNNPSELNVIKDVNTTNLHTHGLHISPQEYSDNVLATVNSDEFLEYNWFIPCDQIGGINWYHPHHHGSTALQVGGGAAGAIIVEDDQEQEGLPDWLIDMDSITLIIQDFKLARLRTLALGINDLNTFSGARNFKLVNGEYMPTICLESNIWMRLRMLHVDISDTINLEIRSSDYETNSNALDCELCLIARDGVLVHGETNEVPRATDGFRFHPSERAEVAILCPYNNDITYELYDIDDDEIIALFSVSNSGINNYNELTTFNPIRPSYHISLLDYDGPFQQYPWIDDELADHWTVRLSATAVNNIPFTPGNIQVELDVNTISQWDIAAANAHPFHMHVNHFQQMFNGNNGIIPLNWDLKGDWVDTLTTNMRIRFYSHAFQGQIVLHCHILQHEDQGAMAIVQINGGCNWDYTGEQCIYNNDGCYDNVQINRIASQ